MEDLDVGVTTGLALLGIFGVGARPAVITIGRPVFRNHFVDFPPGGLLVQVSRRWCTVVVEFILVGANKLCRFIRFFKYMY